MRPPLCPCSLTHKRNYSPRLNPDQAAVRKGFSLEASDTHSRRLRSATLSTVVTSAL
jgi:hypothetical protein